MGTHNDAKIIAFVGLSGTGKSAATKYLREQGIPVVSFSDIIASALKDWNLEFNDENEKIARDKLRTDPTGDIAAARAISQIRHLIDAGQHRIVVDGLGSWDTYKQLRHEFPGDFIIVALTARRTIRHRRLAQRIDHPMTEQQADARDYDSIETLNKGGVIAIADYFIPDDGSIEQLHVKLDELQKEIDF